MEDQVENIPIKNGRKPRKRVKLDDPSPAPQQKKQIIHDHSSSSPSHSSDSSSGWSSEVIEPAIKTMTFRNKRGTRMKELIKGKHKKDQFWDKYQGYFGGDLNKAGEDDEEEDYEASSSGRDEFDSDFDLTDSYVGKRGRKKGTKIKRRRRTLPKKQQSKEKDPAAPKGRRGRKRKVPIQPLPVEQPGQIQKAEMKPQNQIQLNLIQGEESKPNFHEGEIKENLRKKSNIPENNENADILELVRKEKQAVSATKMAIENKGSS